MKQKLVSIVLFLLIAVVFWVFVEHNWKKMERMETSAMQEHHRMVGSP